MTLRQSIIDDASTVFCNASDFAESVVYTKKATGSTRNIDIVVIREAWALADEVEVPAVEVHVTNSATLGITASELVPMKDTLTFALRVGQTATARTIQRIVSHDEGMLVLECR